MSYENQLNSYNSYQVAVIAQIHGEGTPIQQNLNWNNLLMKKMDNTWLFWQENLNRHANLHGTKEVSYREIQENEIRFIEDVFRSGFIKLCFY